MTWPPHLLLAGQNNACSLCGIFGLEITLAYGWSDLAAQRPVRLTGFKRQIDQTPWMVASVRHTLDGNGYVSQLTLEAQQGEGVEGHEGASVNS